uniref:Uncharacterized protein n=1 Tax=Oryza brachyantha TaxID=4533 RepID=J3LA56_ORYBR
MILQHHLSTLQDLNLFSTKSVLREAPVLHLLIKLTRDINLIIFLDISPISSRHFCSSFQNDILLAWMVRFT